MPPPAFLPSLPASNYLPPPSPICCQPSSMMSSRAGVPPSARRRSPACRPSGFTPATAGQGRGNLLTGFRTVSRPPPVTVTQSSAAVVVMAAASRSAALSGNPQTANPLGSPCLTCVHCIPGAPAKNVQGGGYLLLPPRPRAACAACAAGAEWQGSSQRQGAASRKIKGGRMGRQLDMQVAHARVGGSLPECGYAPDSRAAAATPRSSSSKGSVPAAAYSTPAVCGRAGPPHNVHGSVSGGWEQRQRQHAVPHSEDQVSKGALPGPAHIETGCP
jgi:hypothetical protein